MPKPDPGMDDIYEAKVRLSSEFAHDVSRLGEYFRSLAPEFQEQIERFRKLEHSDPDSEARVAEAPQATDSGR